MGDFAKSAYYWFATLGCGIIANHVSDTVGVLEFVAGAALWWGIRAWVDARSLSRPTPEHKEQR